MEESGQLYAPAEILKGKEPPVPMDRRLDGPQSPFERYEEDNESLSPVGNRSPILPPTNS
jgi:hypothetical protein